MNERWKYEVLEIKPGWMGFKPEEIREALNAAGRQGWEWVSFSFPSDAISALAVLKKKES